MRSRLTSITISRAGAIAATVVDHRLHRALPSTARFVLLIVGSLMIGVGAAATIASGLGPGPFDVLVTGIAHRTGLPFAVSLWLFVAVLAASATLLGKRPGVGTALAPLIIGPTVDLAIGPLQALEPTGFGQGAGLVSTVVFHLAGVALIGLGAGAMITSGLGAGTGDLLAAATSSKLGRSIPMVRTGLELSWIGVGVILGGPVGVGTILVAVSIGPAVRLGHELVDSSVTAVTDAARAGGPVSRYARS